MGDLIAALVDMIGIYFLYIIGKYTILILTFGTCSAEPYEHSHIALMDGRAKRKLISKRNTMILGFCVLILCVVVIALKSVPYIVK